ncbi:MAG: hypothetical protein HRU28_13920 [Rhizobiales bacterium]|nr:hypothetical protein [Hyphomicrobiales bacterium]
MFSMIKDIPYIDTIMPLLLALGLWTCTHIFYIGPDIVGPRLATKYYLPACKANLANAKQTSIEFRQRKNARKQYQLQQRQQMIGDTFGNLMKNYFGQEFSNKYSDSMILNPMKMMPNVDALLALNNGAEQAPVQNIDGSAYCACLVEEVITERISMGLFSASMRIWKPKSIRQLENPKTELMTTNICIPPKF